MHTLTLPPSAPRATVAQPASGGRQPAPSPARLRASPPPAWLQPRRQPGRLLLVLGAHLVVAGLLLQTDTVRQVLNAPPPVVVALIGEPSPPPPPAPLDLPRPRQQLPAPMPLPAPEITVAAAPPAPPPAPVLAVATPAPLAPAALPPAPMAVAAPAPPPPVAPVAAPPANPKAMPASAVRYRVPPPVEVPMASRRLGEQGTVLLQVWVDAQGLPRQVTLHRSSGFARLDEQALAAMRQARFQPVIEGGQAIEWVVIAPLQYELD